MFLAPLSFNQDQPQGYILLNYISLNFLGFYVSRMLVEFSLTCIFQHGWENIESVPFYSCPSAFTENFWQNFLKICFPQNRRGGRKLDLLYQNSIRKYEDDLEHQFFSIWYDGNFSKCDGFSYNFVNNIYQIVWY